MLPNRFFPNPLPALFYRLRPLRSGIDGQPRCEDPGAKGPGHAFSSERFQIPSGIADEKQSMNGAALWLACQCGGSMPRTQAADDFGLQPRLPQNASDQCLGGPCQSKCFAVDSSRRIDPATFHLDHAYVAFLANHHLQ
jgi:hypothetical protein